VAKESNHLSRGVTCTLKGLSLTLQSNSQDEYVEGVIIYFATVFTILKGMALAGEWEVRLAF